MEIKELLQELDLPIELADKEIKDVRSTFNKKFIAREVAATDEEIVKTVTGKRMGSISTVLSRELGIAANSDVKIEDLIKEYAATNKERISELETAAKQGNDEKLKKLEDKYLKLETDKKSLEEIKNNLEQQNAQLQSTFEDKIKGFKINSHLNEIKSKVSFIDGLPAVAVDGFYDSHFNKKYVLDLDEKESLVIRDKDGNAIKNEKGTSYLSVEDVIKRDAMEMKILKVNNATHHQHTHVERREDVKPVEGRKLHPRAAANAQS